MRDDDGYFRFVDRLKDSIRRRGENISSCEVEQVLLSPSCVAERRGLPVPSELAEDEVMAAVVQRRAATLDPAALAEFCEPRLAYFAVPRYIEFVDALPTRRAAKCRSTSCASAASPRAPGIAKPRVTGSNDRRAHASPGIHAGIGIDPPS